AATLFFSCHGAHPDLPSFPTRRSSDLPPTPADKPLPLQGPKCLTQGGAGYAELGGELRFRGQTGPGRELAPADPLGQLALNRYRPQPRTLPWHLPLPVHVREYSSDNLGSASGPHVARRVNLGHESGNFRPTMAAHCHG